MPKRTKIPPTIFVVTRRREDRRGTQPLCYLDTRKDADLYITMLRENDPSGTYAIREIVKGAVHVQLH